MTCDLRALTRRLTAEKWHCGGADTLRDALVVAAIKDVNTTDRTRKIVDWLAFMKVLRYFPLERSTAIAQEILRFADEPRDKSLHRDKDKIVSEFNRLLERISKVAPITRTGLPRQLTSLTSKALWCCYPEDVPIFDRNAVGALRVISRLRQMAPERNQSEYAGFVDVWLQVYKEVEPVMSEVDLSDCPYKIRVLDRLLWYLGQPGFYDSSSAG
jgi:hypothetical protein